MGNPDGESDRRPLRPVSDRRLKLEFHGSRITSDADRLGRDPAMRLIVGGKAVERGGASTSQMGRFETELLATNDNLAALADLSGIWIDRVHDRNPPKIARGDLDGYDFDGNRDSYGECRARTIGAR
jgi:hypothetical protein